MRDLQIRSPLNSLAYIVPHCAKNGRLHQSPEKKAARQRRRDLPWQRKPPRHANVKLHRAKSDAIERASFAPVSPLRFPIPGPVGPYQLSILQEFGSGQGCPWAASQQQWCRGGPPTHFGLGCDDR